LPSSFITITFSFFSQTVDHHRVLHSFPTRRSSDLFPRNVFDPLPEFRNVEFETVQTDRLYADFKNFAQLFIRQERICGHLLQKEDRKSTRLNSSHVSISYAVFCLKKKNNIIVTNTK